MTQLGTPSLTVKQALGSLYAGIRPELDRVEKRLRRELRSRHPLVDDVLRHGLRLGGKRLRPALVLLSGQAAGPIAEEHIVLATVMEMIHTATLVHDDVLDEAQLRRHVDTVNARWSNETSVLLGDFLFSHAFYLAATIGTADACRTIGRATNIVCDGELRQTLSGGNLELSEDDYLAIIDAKTAELCACCCKLGAQYAGGDSATVERLASFGRNLGIAFQIADDLLDVLGHEHETGKSLGTDLAKRKLTLPLIHGRDVLDGAERRDFLDLVRRGSPADCDAIRQQLELLGSLDYASSRARYYVDLAEQDLTALPPSDARETLASLAQFAIARSA
jgi:octaprenyl-diphosphate synthase